MDDDDDDFFVVGGSFKRKPFPAKPVKPVAPKQEFSTSGARPLASRKKRKTSVEPQPRETDSEADVVELEDEEEGDDVEENKTEEASSDVASLLAELKNTESISIASRKSLSVLRPYTQTASQNTEDDEIQKLTARFDRVEKSLGHDPAVQALYLENSKRKYQITVTSRLPGSEGKGIAVELKGSKPFGKLNAAVLKHLKSICNIPTEHLHLYHENAVVLQWKLRVRLDETMRPAFLPLPPMMENEKAYVAVDLVTKAAVFNESADKEAWMDLEQKMESENALIQDFVEEASSDLSEPELLEMEEKKESEDAFTVVLRDQDGKLEVRVTPQTKLAKLVEFYKKKRGKKGPVVLEFDDEELDLEGVVADTELEDEFVVDVK